MRDKRFDGILLVSDMDGTLLNAKKEVSSENLAALKSFVAGGGLFTIATGRMKGSVKPYLSCLPVNAPAILYNGCLIYDFSKELALWDKTLPNFIKNSIPHIIEEFHGIGVEIYTSDGDVYALTENVFTDLHRIHDKMEFQKDLDYPCKLWRKILFAWEPEKLEDVESWLIRKGIPLPFVRSEPQFLEILPEQVNKGTALEVLIKHLKINPSGVIAIGDHPNDMEMLQAAGIGIAVDNAHKDLKKVVSFFTTHHDHDAVAEVIKQIRQDQQNWRLEIDSQLSGY